MRNFILGAAFVLGAALLWTTPVCAMNLALDGVATANSEYTPASYAIDGIPSTGWTAWDHGTANDPNWWVVDLQDVYHVDQIVITGLYPDGLYPGYTHVYNFYTGINNADWTLAASGTFVDESDWSRTLSFGTPGIDMRYAKYEVVGGSHWSGLSEIEINGEGRNPSVVPEPASMLLFGTGLVGAFLRKRRV